MRRRVRLIATRVGVLAMVSASLLLFPLTAHADDRDVDGGTVTIQVRIDPLECTSGCGEGSLPVTGLVSPAPLVWVAMALLTMGALLALYARTARRSRLTARSDGVNAYAGVSGDRGPVAGSGGSSPLPPSPGAESRRRESERGDGA